MSKAMVPESIMKIFLMIAVIIVGMAFLMKAFGIDIFGWLENLFGGFNVPNDGKILYIKMDPDDKEVFAFFLTRDPNQEIEKVYYLTQGWLNTYFLPNKLDDKSCVIYTVKERDNLLTVPTSDKGFYYYVNTGAVIQDDTCYSIGTCIKNYINDFGCEEKNIDCGLNPTTTAIDLKQCYPKLAGKFIVGNCGCAPKAKCDDGGNILGPGTDREVEKETFQPGYNFVDFCDKEKLTPKCNILIPGEYKIQFGLLCADGLWRVCKPEGKDDSPRAPINVLGVDVPCTKSSKNIFTWDTNLLQKLPAMPELVSPLDGIMVSLTPILDWNDVTAAKAYKFYLITASQNTENPTYNFCSLNSIGTADGLSGDTTYFWSAKACSDNSCTSCGVYAAERSLYVEKATESTTGWSSFTYNNIARDSTSYTRGLYSIKFSGGSATGRDAIYRFDPPLSLSQSISFFMKSDASGNNVIDVVLRDANQNVAIKSSADTITNNWKSIQINSRDFKVTSTVFDWSRIREISFSISTLQTALWIDGLRFE